jgi:hypothetical protein
MLEDYEVPAYYPEDFFSLMGSERPFYRWIVIGGPRSGIVTHARTHIPRLLACALADARGLTVFTGSPFHLDPFKTSAWNALLVGRKRWVLYPPNQLPPSGVDVDEDEDTGEIDYTGEDPIVWFLEHYPIIKNRYPTLLRVNCSHHPMATFLTCERVLCFL